ncbi:lipase-like PAD4 [Chenopodium quinoa]|uniref:Lipase-like PAD4 n=1 Tax=Chenopodium quinoa TaxID=63459 RepID=A0A803L4T2_CHEQI|nr:lipase-like PAD4 [Chenopodium quinoa]
MEAEGSIFETTEMVANFLASTNLLLDSWRLCNQANSPASGPFLVQHNGPVGLIAFSGMHDLGLGSGSYMNDMVALQEGEIGELFSGLGRHGDDHDEAPVMVHVGLLQLFFGIYGCPSFQAQMKSLLEKSKSIILTGHSIGGAIASLTTLWLLSYIQTIPSPPQILCITFGSPLLGNKSLSKSLLRQRWAGNFCHVVLKHDIIPRLLFAPLAPINTQLHCLLKLIQLSITSQSEQLPFNVTGEIKDQLFRFVLAYTEAVAKETAENMEIPAGLYWPFGNYLFYSDEGTVCVDNADAVVKLLYLMLAMGSSGSCCEDHLKYGGCVERMSFQFLMRRGFIHGDVPASSYDAGLKLAVESSGLASQESVSRQAENSFKMVKQTRLTPSLNSARLAIALAKITPHRAQIEWYKASCDESENQMGYYDSFKRRASKRDYQVNLFRIKLASFWDNVISKIDNNELPHDFHKRRKWVNASHFYQLLVEPLDIAEYYRSGEHLKKGHYLRNGRERRHELFSKWWREKYSDVVEESKRSKFASLTQDSCFWAHVEEARELVEKVRQEKNSSNVAQLLQGIDEFEGYAKKLIDNKEVSSDVLAKNSSYSIWVEEVRELRLQMQQFPQLPSFVDAEMVPRQ